VGNLIYDLKPIREWFGENRAIDITNHRIEPYIKDRLALGKRPATVNRGLQGLRQALRLLHKEGRIVRIPYITMLREDNARQGFFERHDFLAVVDNLPSPYDDITVWAYYSGLAGRKGAQKTFRNRIGLGTHSRRSRAGFFRHPRTHPADRSQSPAQIAAPQ